MTANVQKSVFIAVPPDVVYAEISEPVNLVGLQPLVVEISPIARSEDGDGNTVLTYQSVELFRFGGVLSYRNPIKIQSTLYPAQHKMKSVVKSRPNVNLEFVYNVAPADQGTQLDLAVNYTAPSLVREFVHSQLNAAQEAVLVGLKARLEARG